MCAKHSGKDARDKGTRVCAEKAHPFLQCLQNNGGAGRSFAITRYTYYISAIPGKKEKPSPTLPTAYRYTTMAKKNPT